MAAKDIFSHIQSQQNRMFLVRASFLEIYNEDVRDLLSNSNQTLQVREDPRRGVFVQSVEEIVSDYQSLLKILFHGEKSRAVASTQMNERSSRSHTIFRITIESCEKDIHEDGENDENRSPSGDGAVRVSTLNLVDLAGSESVRHTGATGERQKEVAQDKEESLISNDASDKESIQTLETEIDKLESRNDELQERLATANANVDTLQSQVENIQNQKSDQEQLLTDQIAHLDGEVESAKSRLREVEEEAELLWKEKETCESTIVDSERALKIRKKDWRR